MCALAQIDPLDRGTESSLNVGGIEDHLERALKLAKDEPGTAIE
jgi:hypothetical protein